MREKANKSDTPVFKVTGSFIKNHVRIVKINIPLAKPNNRGGHNSPSKYVTAKYVALMKI
jgi:hypothetical protein